MNSRKSFSDRIEAVIGESIRVKRALLASGLPSIEEAVRAIIGALKAGGKLVVFGNGGSAADSQHIVAELVGRFQKDRRPLPAIALTTNTSTLTAVSNDYGYESSFSRQLEALAAKRDVALAISTSGNARNVIEAVRKAKELGLATIGLSGGDGGLLATTADITIVVPSKVTARVQESHILIGHIICELAERELCR
jgi:D-sedoheptulose 7-phosphate isomerase